MIESVGKSMLCYSDTSSKHKERVTLHPLVRIEEAIKFLYFNLKLDNKLH